MSAAPPLSGPASTTQDNAVQTAPFYVVLNLPQYWDPSNEALTLSYDVHDPNFQIRGGRLYYLTNVTGTTQVWSCLHHQDVPLAQLQHGLCYELGLADRWDGTIDEGLTGVFGEKVTADLSNITIQLVVWNEGFSPEQQPFQPGVEIQTQTGDCFRTSDRSAVTIEAVVEARWDHDFCIPFGDPVEPQHGSRAMLIKVKNVREGTPVHLSIRRIVDIDNASSDTPYSDDTDVNQDKLQGVTVQGNQVLQADGTPPTVAFYNFPQHWPVDSANNFYCFYIAFGDSEVFQVASERDYVNSEHACLHMRFTVFIHMPAADLPEYTGHGARLHQFFRGSTKYYRSYAMNGPVKSAETWLNHFKNRYIVAMLGHAAQGCSYSKHPKDKKGKFVDTYHAGFPPDDYVCPSELSDDPDALALYRSDPRGKAGCGHSERVFHQNKLSGKTWVQNDWKDVVIDIDNPDLDTATPYFSVWDETVNYIVSPESMPRKVFWNGGCRTMVSLNYGGHLNAGGTTYYHGWVYSPSCDYGRMCYDFFVGWIKGSKANPATVEYDNSRIEPSYRTVVKARTRARFNPRMMSGGTVLPNVLPPAGVEDATS